MTVEAPAGAIDYTHAEDRAAEKRRSDRDRSAEHGRRQTQQHQEQDLSAAAADPPGQAGGPPGRRGATPSSITKFDW